MSRSLPLTGAVFLSRHGMKLNHRNSAGPLILGDHYSCWIHNEFRSLAYNWPLGLGCCSGQYIGIPPSRSRSACRVPESAWAEADTLYPVCPPPGWSRHPYSRFCTVCQAVLWHWPGQVLLGAFEIIGVKCQKGPPTCTLSCLIELVATCSSGLVLNCAG